MRLFAPACGTGNFGPGPTGKPAVTEPIFKKWEQPDEPGVEERATRLLARRRAVIGGAEAAWEALWVVGVSGADPSHRPARAGLHRAHGCRAARRLPRESPDHFIF